MEDTETYEIVMSSLCSVEVTSNLDQVISNAGYEVMLDNVSINLTVMLSLCSVEVTSNLDQVISNAGYEVMLDNVSINLTDTFLWRTQRHMKLLCYLYVLSRSQVI